VIKFLTTCEDRKAMVFDQNWTNVGRSNNCVNVWLGGYGV
jgi:hypothetical protein